MITRLLAWCGRATRTHAEWNCGMWLLATAVACSAVTAAGAALAAGVPR